MVTAQVLSTLLAVALGGVLYGNYVLWGDYLEIIAWAFLLSQALYAPQVHSLAASPGLVPPRRDGHKVIVCGAPSPASPAENFGGSAEAPPGRPSPAAAPPETPQQRLMVCPPPLLCPHLNPQFGDQIIAEEYCRKKKSK